MEAGQYEAWSHKAQTWRLISNFSNQNRLKRNTNKHKTKTITKTIIVSGWLMLETMLVGALLLYSSVLVRYFQATSLTCLVEPWLRELGFSTFYGSILIKLYRILTEFQTRKAHRVCMRDKDQIIYLLAIVFIVIGYMSAWTALMVDGFFVRQDHSGSVMDSPFIFRSNPGVGLPEWSPVLTEQTNGQGTGAPAGAPSPTTDGNSNRLTDGTSGFSFASSTSALAVDATGMGHQLELVKRAASNLKERRKSHAENQNHKAQADGDGEETESLVASRQPNQQEIRRLDALLGAPVQSRDPQPLSSPSSSLSMAADANGARLRLGPVAALADYVVEAEEVGQADERGTSPLGAHGEPQSTLEPPEFGPSLAFAEPARGNRFVTTATSSRQAREATTTTKRKREIITSSAGLLNDHLEILARGLNSFGELFLGLLETEQKYDVKSDTFVYFIRCRKLTWDYVTESSELQMPLTFNGALARASSAQGPHFIIHFQA